MSPRPVPMKPVAANIAVREMDCIRMLDIPVPVYTQRRGGHGDRERPTACVCARLAAARGAGDLGIGARSRGILAVSAAGRDGTDALRNWCTTPATTPVGSTAQPAPAKPPRDPDADIVVVDCECLIAMVRPYQLTGEQMAMYLAFVDPRSTTERFLGLAATYRAKHGLAKTRRLMDTFDEMANKLDTCAA